MTGEAALGTPSKRCCESQQCDLIVAVVARLLRKHLGHGGQGQEELCGSWAVLTMLLGPVGLIGWDCTPVREERRQREQKVAVGHEQCLAGVTGVQGAGQRGAQLSLLPRAFVWLCRGPRTSV